MSDYEIQNHPSKRERILVYLKPPMSPTVREGLENLNKNHDKHEVKHHILEEEQEFSELLFGIEKDCYLPLYILGVNQLKSKPEEKPKYDKVSGAVDLILENRADTVPEEFKYLGVTAGHVLLNSDERRLCSKKPESQKELEQMTPINPNIIHMVLEDQIRGQMGQVGKLLTAVTVKKYCRNGRNNGHLDCMADVAVFSIPQKTIEKFGHRKIPPHNFHNFKSNLSTPLFLKPEVMGAEMCGILRIKDYRFPSLERHLKERVCVVIGDTAGRIQDLCPLGEQTGDIVDAIYFTITTERR